MTTYETLLSIVSQRNKPKSAENTQMVLEGLIKGARGVEEATGGRIRARQVYHMVERGQLPVIRKGRAMYFRTSELEDAFRSAPAK